MKSILPGMSEQSLRIISLRLPGMAMVDIRSDAFDQGEDTTDPTVIVQYFIKKQITRYLYNKHDGLVGKVGGDNVLVVKDFPFDELEGFEEIPPDDIRYNKKAADAGVIIHINKTRVEAFDNKVIKILVDKIEEIRNGKK